VDQKSIEASATILRAGGLVVFPTETVYGLGADAVLAFAPGAQDTMMVLALAMHLDPVFVGALQLSRFLLVSLLVPFLAHRIRRMRPEAKRAHPPGATRPEVEDKQLDK